MRRSGRSPGSQKRGLGYTDRWVPEHRELDTVVSMCMCSLPLPSFSLSSLSSLSQISSSQEEYDCLKVVQSQQISEHQQRLTDATTVLTQVVC